MHRSIKLGRYIAAESPIHRLDPRAKIIAMILYFAMILTIHSLVGLAVLAAGSLLIIGMTRIPFKAYLRTLRPLRYLIAFIFLFPVLFGEHDLAANLVQGTVAAGRMTLFILFSAVLTFTTPTARLIQGLERLLQPFRILGVSPEKWSMMINLALRFIPTIIDEAKIILKAQASRGADFAERSWKEKAKVLITLLVPVTAGTFRRAQELTDSMEARGFVPGMPRTSYHQLTWSRMDSGFVLCFAVVFMLALAWRVLV